MQTNPAEKISARDARKAIGNGFGHGNPDTVRPAVLTFVDTAGAYPGIGAEERGQAKPLPVYRLLPWTRTPIIPTIIGEGGSGGAVAIGTGLGFDA